MTIKDWMDEVKLSDTVDLQIRRVAIKNLLEWDVFNSAYKYHGLREVQIIITIELENRGFIVKD